jgi:adenylate cyclase
MLEEARRRNVHRVALAYIAASWLLVQVVETLMPAFDVSPQVLRVLVILLVIGFVPAVVLAWVFEWTPDGLRREIDLDTRQPRAHSRTFDRVIAVVLAVAVAYFAIDKFVLDPARDRTELEAAREAAARSVLSGEYFDEAYADRSILVVPFLNLSSDPEQGYLADSLSEELLNRLAQMEKLRVISRSTAWTFKNREVDVAAINEKLGVTYLLEGSVLRSGNEVRVSARLIDARTNTHLWGDSYDRTFDDILAIQDEISLAVADQMHLEIVVPGSPHEGVDPRAYELLLRAGVDQIEGVAGRYAEAEKLLQQAIDIEPSYLEAIYDLSYIYYAMPVASVEEGEENRRRVLELVDKLEELAPESAYTNNWKAYIELRWNGDPIAAAPYLEKSMRYANRTDLHVWFRGAMELLGLLGRDDEAMVVGQYWINRDPGCVSCLGGFAGAMRRIGRYEEAVRILESALRWQDLTPVGYWNLGVAQLFAGEPDKALQNFEQIPEETDQVDREFARAFALYSLGRQDEFDAIVSRRIVRNENPEGIARLYAWSHQQDKAFEWLERVAREDGVDFLQMAQRSDLYGPIKSDPRWQELLERYGLTEKPVPKFRFDPEYPPILQRAVDVVRESRPAPGG